ncbi:MAG: hypothetical protein ACM3YN_12245 [Parcubacteria group bacterium]
MDRLTTSWGASGSARRGLAWLGGLIATVAALTIGAILAVFAAATVVVMALMTSALLAFSGIAVRARRRVHARAADPTLIEARRVGGHHWVAYGWNERR